MRCIEVVSGLKIEVRDFELPDIVNNTFVSENFDLGIKRLNRWWYSVYFGRKPYELPVYTISATTFKPAPNAAIIPLGNTMKA